MVVKATAIKSTELVFSAITLKLLNMEAMPISSKATLTLQCLFKSNLTNSGGLNASKFSAKFITQY
jgi:hypothetical protein